MAQHELGVCYMEGKGTKKNRKAAIKWLLKAAETQYALGAEAFESERPNEARFRYEKALESWKLAAENGSAQAKYELQNRKYYDQLTEETLEEELMREAEICCGIDPIAWRKDAVRAMKTIGVIELEKLEELSRLGDMDSQYELGLLYLEGDRVPKDTDKAIQNLRQISSSHSTPYGCKNPRKGQPCGLPLLG